MRPVLFVVCFTLGVGLMVFSGYLPRQATAGDHVAAPPPAAPDEIRFDAPNYYPERTASHSARSVSYDDTTASPDDFAEPAEPDDLGPAGPPDPRATLARDPHEPRAAVEPTLDDLPLETPDSPADLGPPPVASAGPDRVVWMGWDELKLNGSASKGAGLAYEWLQTAGPQKLIIRDNEAAETIAYGFDLQLDMGWRDETYAFELMVVDEHGHESFDTVEFRVKPSPGITITPGGERRYEYRDGYVIAWYDAWLTNLETYESTFQVVAHHELTFTRVAGVGAFDISGGKSAGLYVYRITLYASDDEPSTWVEFLVDTAESIPGIVQLGVNWVGR